MTTPSCGVMSNVAELFEIICLRYFSTKKPIDLHDTSNGYLFLFHTGLFSVII